MKKIVSIVIMTVFFSQSLLTSYMYAADAPASVSQEATTQVDETQQMIDGFLRTDISTLDALSILQI